MKQNPAKYLQSVDPILGEVIAKIKIPQTKKRKSNYFRSLVEAIISQQLSNKAADTLILRFRKLFPGKVFPRPADVLKIDDEKIRAAGLSYSKIGFIKDLAEKIETKQLNLQKLKHLEDEQLIETLVRVKGIGKWTAEMFMMFSLERPDIFSHGDLGLRNAIQKLYGKKKPLTQKQIEKIVAKWSPHKTMASRYLWRSLDNN